jgi:tetratricopeptide (TPR) repeat protein
MPWTLYTLGMVRMRFFLMMTVLAGCIVAAQQSTGTVSAPVANAPDALEEVESLLHAGKADDAAGKLRSYLAVHPESLRAQRDRGLVAYARSDYGAAIPDLQNAVSRDPNDREATQLLGLSYYILGRATAAIPLLEKVREWFPSAHLDASYYLASAYLQIRRYDDARAAFAEAYDIPTDSAAADLLTARMLLRQEYEPVAEEYARKALAKDPKLPLAHFLVGEIYLFKADPLKAIEEFEAELKVNPAHAPTYVRLADAYVRASRFDAAERVLSRAIYLDSTSSAAYMLLGRVLLRKSDPARATAALQRAVALDPNNYQAHHQLGQALMAMGKRTEGEAELQRAQELQSAQRRLPVEKK